MKIYRIEPYLDDSIAAFIIPPDFCKDLLLDTDSRETSLLDRSLEEYLLTLDNARNSTFRSPISLPPRATDPFSRQL